MLLGFRVTLVRIYVGSEPATAEPSVTNTEELPVEVLQRIDPLWLKVQKALFDALRPFAEARKAVARALENMEALSSFRLNQRGKGSILPFGA